MNKLIISPAPHIHSGDSISKNMYAVLLALVPAYLVGLYFFGIGAFVVSITAVLSCIIFEFLIQKFILPLPRSSEQLLFIFSIFLVCNQELSSSSTKPKVSVS